MKRIAVVVGVMAIGVGCSKQSSSETVRPLSASASLGAGQSAGGIRFSAPSSWSLQAPRPMRAATYKIPAAAGTPDDAECGVFYFGAAQGGSVDANLSRWLGQFTQPNGQPIADFARREKRTIGGVAVTVVDVSGTFLFSPTPMSPEHTPKAGYRMLGAIVEAPQGSVFIKLTGPEATVAANQSGFEALLNSITRS